MHKEFIAVHYLKLTASFFYLPAWHREESKIYHQYLQNAFYLLFPLPKYLSQDTLFYNCINKMAQIKPK